MELVLHLGLPRTGSTAFQHWIADLSRTRQADAFIPDSSCWGGPEGEVGHNSLILRDRDGAASLDPHRCARLKKCASTVGAESVILSAEDGCLVSAHDWSAVFPGWRIRPVYVVRDIASWSGSIWRIEAYLQLRTQAWSEWVLSGGLERLSDVILRNWLSWEESEFKPDLVHYAKRGMLRKLAIAVGLEVGFGATPSNVDINHLLSARGTLAFQEVARRVEQLGLGGWFDNGRRFALTKALQALPLPDECYVMDPAFLSARRHLRERIALPMHKMLGARARISAAALSDYGLAFSREPVTAWALDLMTMLVMDITPLPQGFDSDEYLRWNHDVAAAGVLTAQQHWLLHGGREGRKFRAARK